MFGLGMPEILLILAIALIVVGPKKLPDLAKTLGQAMGEFKRSAQDFKRNIDIESTMDEMETPAPDLKKVVKEVNKEKENIVEPGNNPDIIKVDNQNSTLEKNSDAPLKKSKSDTPKDLRK
ncbi:MAG: hypothetical protein GY710_20750 [Desulfobacteraceae bacterium]|nr:hypothetical protein [Desulfobacteraceae bacterium]